MKLIDFKFKQALEEPDVVSEAFFLIVNIVLSTFAFSFLIAAAAVVASPSAKAAQPACCERLKGTDLYCQDAVSDLCDPAFKSAPTSCDATSFCKLGCCYDSAEGTCAENTPRKICEGANGTFDVKSDCKIAQCTEGCCILGSEASLTTLVRCKKLASYYGLDVDFRSGITKEADCTAIAQAQDKGACVIATPTETTCKFTTRGECKTLTHNETAFNKDFLCSAEKLATNCARQARTGCIEGKDEVYWFDSCGNQENIYDSDKTRSYNSGKVLSKEQSCNPSSANANSPGCGNCQYFLGSMCGTARAGKEPKPTFGENICRDLNCYKTSNGNDYKHGESWCVYDAAVGEGKDVVGSRHWRHLCVQGEEIVEPCDDYRQAVCIQDKVDISGSPFNEALCKPNRWRDCVSITNKKDCEEKAYRDCYWAEGLLTSSVGGGGEKATTKIERGICLPNVPPGLEFWQQGQAKTICSAASTQCKASYTKEPLGNWKCVANCECMTEEWTQRMNKICTSLGDCGAKVNIVGKITTDGYSISSEGKKLSTDYLKELTSFKGSYGLSLALLLVSGVAYKWLVLDRLGSLKSAVVGTGGQNLIPFLPASLTEVVSSMFTGLFDILHIAWNIVSMPFGKPAGLVTGLPAELAALGPSQLWSGTSYMATYSNIYRHELAKAALQKEVLPTVQKIALEKAKEEAAFYERLYAISKPDAATFAKDVATVEKHISDYVTDKVFQEDSLGQAFGGTIKVEDPALLERAGKPVMDLGVNINVGVQKDATTQAITDSLKNSKVISKDGFSNVVKSTHTATAQNPVVQAANIMRFVQIALWAYTIWSIVKILFTKKKEVTVSFTCMPWQAPTGGADCEKCNKDPMKPCSQYRCKSLGSYCSLLNEGMGNESCVNLNPQDTTSPKLKPSIPLLTSGHSYTDVKPCPPGPGCWKIVRTGATDGCIKAFTPLTFGIETDELAQCKVDYNHTAKFDNMQFWFGETNLYLYNHTMTMSLPGPSQINAQSPEIKNDGKYTLFVRCRDGNGNANLGEMAMQFCVEAGPDTTPPVIVRTGIDNGAPISYNAGNTSFEMFLNEPAECRWSKTDQAYENMNNTFTCATFIEEMEMDMTYRCNAFLTGIQNRVENVFYFRCKDQPWLSPEKENDRNANKESYVFRLQGTVPLNITKVEPNGTIRYGSSPIPVTLHVETANGYRNGEAKCYFSPSGFDNMVEFYSTGTNVHEQKLDLTEIANNTYYILCRDLGGNVDTAATSFTTEVDTKAPLIIRIYQEGGMLKVVTDEESECRYSIKDCKFDFATATDMPFAMTTGHTAEWRTDITYYIKCKDKYGNMPLSSECTMQVNAYDVPGG